MKKIVLAALLIFSAIGCESDDNKETNSGSDNAPATIQFTTLAKGEANPASPISPRFYVLRTQAEYNTFKTQTGLLNGLSVDFAVNEVIVVFDEYQFSGGYSIAITGITKLDNKLTVKLQSTAPEGEVTTLEAQPFHAVRLQKTGLPVVFEEDSPL